MFLQYLWHALMDFHQTSVSSSPWDKDELIRFGGQKVKSQGHRVEASELDTLCREFCLLTTIRFGKLHMCV